MSAGIAIAIIMIVAAAYFTWQQITTLQMVGSSPKIPIDQRRYLYKQCWRRMFGSLVLALLAVMIIGSLFLNYEPLQKPIDELPQAEQEAAKQAFRFISMYWIALLMFVMAALALAVFDLWATARHGMQQQKQLFLEHQEILAAELEELRHRQSEMN
jgi:flagellar biosynthesis protein FlhB